ncbi:MAG TPA: hypothetical protein VKW76_16950 [Candidatus Binatia bacterium]|nr:hypothetical protein [Candidatus Binatia bacterium]
MRASARGLLLLAFIAAPLLRGRPALGAIALVQTIGTSADTTTGTTLSVTVPATGVAAGDSIILTFTMGDVGTAVSAADSAGNVYNVDVQGAATGLVRTVVLSAHGVIALAPGDVITVTHPSTTVRALSATEFSGLAPTATLDQTQVAGGTGTAPASGATAPTTQPDELLIGAIGTDGPVTDAFTAGTGYTALTGAGTAVGTDVTIDPEFAIVSATGAYAATGTLGTSRDWAAAIATYVAAPPPTTTTSPTTTTTSTTTTTTTTLPAVCGDGIVEAGEQCDDGAANGTINSCCTATCTFQPAGTNCADDGNPCTVDQCNGTSDVCQHVAGNAGAVCRLAAGPCDTAGICTGTSPTCPADVYKPAGTVCRPAVGTCDIAETCTGTSPLCPQDQYQPAGTVCRPAAGPCDAVETCTGTNPYCPPDALLPATTVCRPAAGPCDLAENCTGTSALCPPDSYLPAGTVCRPAAGPCDVAEVCSGQSTQCPADAFAPATTVCRAAAGACDVAEYCTGTSVTCPPNTLEPAGTVCRPAAGVCDVAEVCDGVSSACPADAKQPSTTLCRPAVDVCDAAEYCDGVSNDCPPDAMQPAGTICRAPDSACDTAERCDGVDSGCPSDPDGGGASDAVCPCTSPAPQIAPKAKLEIKGMNLPPGHDRLTFVGVATGLPTSSPIDPVSTGLRVLIDGTPTTGNVLDVTVPPGAFDSATGVGWKANTSASNFLYLDPAGLQGITKVHLRLRRETPGEVKFVVVAKNATFNAGFPIAPAQLPLTGLLVLDPPLGANGQCAEATFPGPAPAPSCTASTASVRCK